MGERKTVKQAPRGIRLVIALIGRRNSGKSSLINAITKQKIAIVSEQPGTTTDPVGKHYELLPLGPVTFFDTAGLDDQGELGSLRIQSTRKILFRTDLAILVIGENGITNADKAILTDVHAMTIPVIVVFNKSDLASPSKADIDFCSHQGIPFISTSAKTGENITLLKSKLIDLAPPEMKKEPQIVSDLITEGNTVVLVVPIDLGAPKGRLILPQVQVIREILDCDACAIVVKERELAGILENLAVPPALVIADSQVILKVAGDINENIPLTTFSILFARMKGDIHHLIQGAQAIDNLNDNDRILIAEACSHHVQADDIGRVKIPRWLTRYTGKDLSFEVYSGHDFPEDLSSYRLVVHCGSCMLNRMEMIRRINECQRRGIPITNYGLTIAKTLGVFDRVIAPLKTTC
ncbi:[FeFe] hydrogenase H-cluster maturation GTPase HydF [bacterium]|nr:[FeFe] hydrogenase H-cluster maturation GTPase HydF [candidate division CSSED10-310 bacterium]